MVTITGNGMGDYDFKNLPKEIDLEAFDAVICDRNFKVEGKNIHKFSYKEAKNYILSHYKTQNILYVVTGSPLFFSAGTIIAKQIPDSYLKIIPATSSKDYILSRLGISESEVESISLHGREEIDLERFLKQKFTLILTDSKSIARLLEATKYLEPEMLEWFVGYKMGYEDEFIGRFDPRNPDFDQNKPFVVVIKRLFDYQKSPLKDENFLTERGMITKQYKRDLALQFLELYPNLSLWDIGAGSGSCAIEAFRRYRVKTTLFEKNPTRCDFIEQNLKNHKVCNTKLFRGEATESFEKISKNPDRVFVGGGGDEVLERLGYLFERLNSSGVMVIMAVTLRTLTKATQILEESNIDYEVISLGVTNWSNRLKMAEPQRELFVIRVVKS